MRVVKAVCRLMLMFCHGDELVLKLFKIVLSVSAFAMLAACGGGGGGNSDLGLTGNTIVTPPDGTFRAAQATSPYRQVLVNCLMPATNGSLCKLATLPFIGQHAIAPTKADILAHTIVSHPWMATRFSELLDQMPNDILLLFRGVTGVTIGADIRPSYYDPETGGIYLDPEDLWLNLAERNTVSKVPDFRSDFGSDLKFAEFWRYVKDGDYAWSYYPLDGAVSTRSISDIVKPMASLLFHELAHANDFMPPALLSSVNSQNTVIEQSDAFGNNYISVDLNNRSPLLSSVMKAIGQVLYRGVTATSAQKQLTAGQVGQEFETDGASAGYAYSSMYEDTAMLFEEVMMKYHYNIDREQAFVDQPTVSNPSCDMYVVRWGQRNRIGDPLVKSRAQIVVGQLLGRTDTSAYFAILPSPRYMVNGAGWCSNLDLMAPSSNNMQKTRVREMHPTDLLPPH